MAKLGRPPKSSTGIEPIAPALWDRIRRNVGQGLLPAIHGTEIARLHHFGLITPTEAAAAFRIAEIYSRWDKCLGRARSARSPSFELGFGGSVPENQKAADQKDADDIKREKDAREKWDALEEKFNKLNVTPSERRRIEELCAQNEAIGSIELSDIRPILAGLAQEFRVVTAGKNSALKRQAKDITNPKAATPRPKPNTAAAERKTMSDITKSILKNASQDQIDTVYETFTALRSLNLAKQDRGVVRDELAERRLARRKP